MHSGLRDAIIIADPDYLLEALPFGNVVKFTKKARLSIDLGDILATARTLQAESGKPVLILLHQKLDHLSHRSTVMTPEQVRYLLDQS
jgi:hypothetical protein